MNRHSVSPTERLGLVRRIIPALMLMMGVSGISVARAEPGTAAPVPQPAQSDAAASAPVTVVVMRFVKRGCEARFEQMWRDMIPIRSAFPGHLGSDIIAPATPGERAYHMLFRFDTNRHYQAWVQSPERAAWLHRLDSMTLGEPQYQYENDLGAWVVLPEQQSRVPEKYKTTVVTWLAIFPLVAGISVATSAVTVPLVGPLPFLANIAIVTGLVVPALSYVVMPPMTWLFRDWLYPADPACQAALND